MVEHLDALEGRQEARARFWQAPSDCAGWLALRTRKAVCSTLVNTNSHHTSDSIRTSLPPKSKAPPGCALFWQARCYKNNPLKLLLPENRNPSSVT